MLATRYQFYVQVAFCHEKVNLISSSQGVIFFLLHRQKYRFDGKHKAQTHSMRTLQARLLTFLEYLSPLVVLSHEVSFCLYHFPALQRTSSSPYFQSTLILTNRTEHRTKPGNDVIHTLTRDHEAMENTSRDPKAENYKVIV